MTPQHEEDRRRLNSRLAVVLKRETGRCVRAIRGEDGTLELRRLEITALGLFIYCFGSTF